MYQELTAEKKKGVLWGTIALSLFWVIFIWNFWQNGIYALGFNATIFLWAMLALFFYATNENYKSKVNLSWLIPVFFISLSFSLYENPFLKIINFLSLPFIFAFFSSYRLLGQEKIWNFSYIFKMVFYRLSFLFKLKSAYLLWLEKFPTSKKQNVQLAQRILLGTLLLILVAFFVIIPLLSAADPNFAQQVEVFTDWFYELISWEYLIRVIFFALWGVLLTSLYLSLERDSKAPATVAGLEKAEEQKEKLLDPVVSGIVLSGVLVLYLLFLSTQLSYLWVDRLPVEFQRTEQLVKSGFWQLFLLSILNILFFMLYYQKTNRLVQNILKGFMLASLLLLVSAGQRMFLYAFHYGLSYEKFFASYTVLYFAVLFLWLLGNLLANKKADPLKFIVFSLLWMYGVLTVLPVERMIFQANVKLLEKKDSKINLFELRMLSSDALPLVVGYSTEEKWQKKWCQWYHEKTDTIKQKRWYEKNLTNLLGSGQAEKTKNFDSCNFQEESVY